MKKILLIIILLTSACGYNPIYLNKNLDNFKFLTVTLNGDKEINRKIVSALSIKEDKSNLNNENLILDSSFKIEETSKNSTGQVTSYRSTITVKFTIKENNEIKNNKEFRDSFAYGNRENKFDLVTYQDEVKNNLTNKIIEEIIFYMNLE